MLDESVDGSICHMTPPKTATFKARDLKMAKPPLRNMGFFLGLSHQLTRSPNRPRQIVIFSVSWLQLPPPFPGITEPSGKEPGLLSGFREGRRSKSFAGSQASLKITCGATDPLALDREVHWGNERTSAAFEICVFIFSDFFNHRSIKCL